MSSIWSYSTYMNTFLIKQIMKTNYDKELKQLDTWLSEWIITEYEYELCKWRVETIIELNK